MSSQPSVQPNTTPYQQTMPHPSHPTGHHVQYPPPAMYYTYSHYPSYYTAASAYGYPSASSPPTPSPSSGVPRDYLQQTPQPQPRAPFQTVSTPNAGSLVTQPVSQAQQPANGRKRKAPPTTSDSGRNKRPNKENVPPGTLPTCDQPPSSCGVGPVNEPLRNSDVSDDELDELVLGDSDPELRAMMSRLSEQLKSGDTHYIERSDSATDVWWFYRPLKTRDRPNVLPADETVLRSRPKDAPFVGCKLCTKQWKVYKVDPKSSMTSCLRKHLNNKHQVAYQTITRLFKLKNFANQELEAEPGIDEAPFDPGILRKLLLKWAVADDQSMNGIENPELRAVLLYAAAGKLVDSDIPRRAGLTKMALDEHKEEMERIRGDLLSSVGRVSYSLDLWSSHGLDSYMAVTAHYIIRTSMGRLEYRCCLVAFRKIEGSHTGVNLASSFYDLLIELGVTHKIGLITMDNASNNNTLMAEFAEMLKMLCEEFDADGNRIRCFPHIIHLCCGDILSSMTANISPNEYDVPESVTANQEKWQRIVQIFKSDLVGRVRKVVAACRVSGQRRQSLQEIIRSGNERKAWGNDANDEPIVLPLLQLLRDCETRWSSTYNMISRFLLLYPAIRDLLNRLPDLRDLDFKSDEIQLLDELVAILRVPHRAQELLSAERTPTLSIALPVYRLVIDGLKTCCKSYPHFQHFIKAGIRKIEEKYLPMTRKTRAYTIAMVVNPAIKLLWTKRHTESHEDAAEAATNMELDDVFGDSRAWGDRESPEFKEASNWLKEAMLKFQAHCRQKASRPIYPSKSSSARVESAKSLAKGLAGLVSLTKPTTLARSLSAPSISSSSPPIRPTTLPTPTSPATEEDKQALENALLQADRRTVELKFRRYLDKGLLTDVCDGLDQLGYWERNEQRYPNLFRVAMDILPAQASSVSVERVFSSGKETDTLKRCNLSSELFEALQILKFSFKQQRLTFTDWLVDREEDYNIDGPVTQFAIQQLLKEGKYDELEQLLQNSLDSCST